MGSTLVSELERTTSNGQLLDAHVVLLDSYIPPHVLPVYVELSKRVRKLTILLSTPMESHRTWKPDFGSLDVRLQRTWTIERPWKHPAGFRDKLNIHIPWNTGSLLRELRPDVIISKEFGARSLLSARYARSTNTPLILVATLSEHQELGRGWARYMLRRWLIRQATCIAVNGPSAVRYMQRLGAAPERLVHVPYTAVPNCFDRVPLTRKTDEAHNLLFVGRLVEGKGLMLFAKVLADWAQKHPTRSINFDLAGTGPLDAALAAYKFPENVRLRLLGEQSYSQLAECFSRAGILVFPTLSDEWGMVVNESLSAGVPVLGSIYSQAVEELCIEGKTGWRFRTNVANEMEQALDRALETPPSVLNEMRRAGRELVKGRTPAFGADRYLTAIKLATLGGECSAPSFANGIVGT